MSYQAIADLADRLRANIGRVIVGKDRVVDQLFIALVTSGHVLLEDVPGTGKTLLVKSLAKSLNLQFRRVQFTPDLLPSDLSGIQYYNQKENEFEFRSGPLFTHLLLADEINRATPRTQSSLLECMEERQISVEGETRQLDKPFMVLATQNPVEHQGTFPLPEAQLDRFLFKIAMGYPTTEEALQILRRFQTDDPLEQLQPVATASEIAEAQRSYRSVRISDDVLRYLLSIVEKTRTRPEVQMGVSPRGSQALLRAAQVQAILNGRDYVTPDDVKAMAAPVLAHRLSLRGMHRTQSGADIVAAILKETEVPTEAGLSVG
ncbi:AAA family ATPase [Paenibacillus sp. NPDC058071]|uniref:AAA family ATPase n=1 Tax=Paenibacillus sp. NPDC058071 TaxID=3346326 RepID=UPI0036D84F68